MDDSAHFQDGEIKGAAPALDSRLQARVRAFFNSVPVGLIILTKRGAIAAVNPVLAKLVERDETEFFGQDLSFLFKKSSLDKLAPHLLTSGKATRFELLELEVFTKQKEIIVVDAAGSIIQGDDDIRTVISLTDATERIQLELLRQELLDIVSHDLRSPLASLHSYLQVLKSGEFGTLNSEGLDRLQIAESGISRLNRMIQDLLEMAQFDAGVLKLNQTNFNSDNLVDQSFSSIAELAKGKSITMNKSGSSINMYGDQERLTQVLVNLLSNAIQYSPSGTEIIVTTRVTEPETLEISVEDQGSGIKTEEQNLIFERFRRVANTRYMNVAGIGLGLAICRQIVELHEGCIGCGLSDKGGSIFWFRLPFHN